MPVVRVKGVANPMQFPDDMDINDIREFLRRRFMSQMGESQPDLAPIESVAQEVKPSLAERAGQGISNALYDSGIISDRYGAQRIGSNLSSIGEFLPVIGDATAGDEFGRAAAQGDNAGMLLAGLGAIPLVGDAAKKGYRGISSANKRIDPNITWFSADEKLAKGYSDTNKAFSADLNIKRPFDAGDDKNTTTPLRFANQALSQMGADNIDKKTAMLIKADFLSNYPDPRKEVRVIDFWASDDGKDNVANLLQDLGFDAVRLKEEGVETYGMIRMKAE